VITGGATGVVHGKTAVTALTSLDEFILWEDTAAAERKITYANLLTALSGDLDSGTIMGFDIFTGTATINPAAFGADDGLATFTITVTGASTTNTPAVVVTPSIQYPDFVILHGARVSGANTVTFDIRVTSESVGYDLPSHTVRATVFQF
jgi:hypothetical protein